MIQIFSAIMDENRLLQIAKQIKEQISQSNIIGTATVGVILEGSMPDKKGVSSLPTFENTRVRSSIYNFSDDLSTVNYAIDEEWI